MSTITWIPEESTAGIWLSTGSMVAAELASIVGFDWALVDLEHGQCGEAEALHLIRILSSGGCAPIVRLPDAASSLANRLLDAGAAGLMAPQITNAATAATFAARLRYPTAGTRGVSSSCRAAGYGSSWPAYRAEADGRLCAMVQIEDPRALADVEAIAAQPGVDVLFLGHSDLAATLACGPQDP
ncbi:MAG: HpcH/HpaI aldolase family protein, partial [Candidatus Sumerlaeota bacterium]